MCACFFVTSTLEFAFIFALPHTNMCKHGSPLTSTHSTSSGAGGLDRLIDCLASVWPFSALPYWCQFPSRLDVWKHMEVPAGLWSLWTPLPLSTQLKSWRYLSFKTLWLQNLMLYGLTSTYPPCRREQSHWCNRCSTAGGQQDEAQPVCQVFHGSTSTQSPQPHQPGVLRH